MCEEKSVCKNWCCVMADFNNILSFTYGLVEMYYCV
jgi:hypothetical protein